jgi:ABC-type multidrug transport system ATPase subunit
MSRERELALSLSGVTKRYGRVTVLNDVSFGVEPGSVVALLGPNGAGKTTTFKCVLGVIEHKGEILVAGRSVRRDGKAARRLIGYVPQDTSFFGDDRCADALEFLAELRGVALGRVDEILEKVNLAAQRGARADRLSGGMRQRLALAAALLSDPLLLLLDEPTANLDVESRAQFFQLVEQLRDEGKAVVISTHFVEHVAPLADRVVVLRDGGVALNCSADDLWRAGKDFTVHLNGVPAERFMTALRGIGVHPLPARPGAEELEAALTRALGETPGKQP